MLLRFEMTAAQKRVMFEMGLSVEMLKMMPNLALF